MPNFLRKKFILNHFYVLLLCLAFSTTGQKVKFEFFTAAEGLAGNNTATVAQDQSGFLWFINEGQLHRHDGRNFLVFSPPKRDSSKVLGFLGVAEYQDSLLFVWGDKTAYLFSPSCGKWKQIAVDNSVLSDGETFFWHRMGTDHILLNRGKREKDDASLVLFENNTLSLVKLPTQLKSFKNTVIGNTNYFLNYWCDIDANGNVNLVYLDTLFQFTKSGEILNKVPLTNICTNCYNICFRFTPENKIVLATNWQLFILDELQNEFLPHPANKYLKDAKINLHRFIIEKNGSIWACGADRNLLYYDAPKDVLYNYHDDLRQLLKSANDFKGLYKDASGVVWIATRLGLLKVIPQAYSFETYLTQLNNANAFYSFRGFTESAEGKVFGVFYNGIAKINPETKKTEQIYSFDSFLNLFDLFTDDDKIWVNGGQYFDEKKGQLARVPSPFFDHPVSDNGYFARDPMGSLWWLSHSMLFSLDISASQPKWEKVLDLEGNIFYRSDALHFGAKSNLLWISYTDALIAYNPKTKIQEWYKAADLGLSFTRITFIQENNDGSLWLGTDIGLVHFNPSSRRKVLYSTVDGLPNNFVCGALPEGDTALWVSTNHGLSRFNLRDKSFVNFFEDDGLSHNEFNRKSYYKARNGKMYFGGMRGVNAFFPQEIMQTYRDKGQTAKLILSAFEYADERFDTILNRTTFGTTPEINIFHWHWSFNFQFVLTDYSNPNEVFYSYRMEGYKDAWSTPSKLNSARYNSLPVGEYTFYVKARDSRGRWLSNQLAVHIIVHPPWWLTNTAYLVYILTFLFLLRVFSKFRERRLIMRQRVLEQTVNTRTAELVAEKQEVERQKQRSDELLLNILPTDVAEELKTTGKAEAQFYDEVTVMFTDFSDFTQHAQSLTPSELVEEIDTCFKAFDAIITAYKLEKIKTIGDAYMCAGGLNRLGIGGPTAVILAAIEMQEFMQNRKSVQSQANKPSFSMRVGIHTGPVVAGIVGDKKFQYDIWGDTVNTANRMETMGEINKVNISECTYKSIKYDLQFKFESRGAVEVKGKGAIEMWFVSLA
jgi:class 3 adenylate cyclase/ligand-binding sensor domain-containing protein